MWQFTVIKYALFEELAADDKKAAFSLVGFSIRYLVSQLDVCECENIILGMILTVTLHRS